MRRYEMIGALLVFAGFFGGMVTILMRIEPSIAGHWHSTSSLNQSLDLECPEVVQIGQPTTVQVTFTNRSNRVEHYQIFMITDEIVDGWGEINPSGDRFTLTLYPQETTTLELNVPIDFEPDSVFVQVHATSEATEARANPTYWSFYGSCDMRVVDPVWQIGIRVAMNLSAGLMLLGIASLAYARRPLKEKRKRFSFAGEN